MIFGTFPAKARRRRGLVILALFGFVFLPGCEPDPYPADLKYPFRGDLLVDEAKGRNVPATFGPGQLETFLAGLKQFAEPGKAPPGMTFRVFDPAKLEADQRQKLRSVLNETFGTPSAPRVFLEEGDLDEPGSIQDLQIDGALLGKGSVLYRRHCLHCHGVAGDGHGPTAPWINPPPRDFRRGAFKFTSVVNSPGKMKPTRADLVRTLREGIEGTAMPNFRYLKDDEVNALISYVIHLSVRGMTEYGAIKDTLNGEKFSDKPFELVTRWLNDSLKDWKESAKPLEVIKWPAEYDDPDKLKESVGAGYKLFIGKGGCIDCHTDFGRQSQFIYDIWGTLVKPNNLTQGVFRGGRRPIDVYYRLSGGIDPSTMPKVDLGPGNEKDVWALVNFVRALPYPSMLPDDVRAKVYGPSGRK